MNILYKCLTGIALAVLLVAVIFGLVSTVDQLGAFHNESWMLPIFLLLAMAAVPIVLFFAIVDEDKTSESDESREEDTENNMTDGSD